jgi:NAD(P)H-flavin reductase
MLPVPHRIRQLRRETHDTFTMELEPMDGSSPMSFRAGQFNMLYVFGVGEVAISISGNPATVKSLVHTVRAVGAVTNVMSRLKRGDVLGVRGPFGNPWPLAEAEGKDVVIVTGGVGLAPLRSVMYHIIAYREQYDSVVLLYGARTPKDLLYHRELERWRSRFDLHVEVTLDTATSDWRGHVGVVTTLIGRAPFDPLDSVAMICGPEVMMRFTIQELQKRGMSAEQIYVSMERNMKCAVGFCGHCQYGPTFMCKDGPVYRYDEIERLFKVKEV